MNEVFSLNIKATIESKGNLHVGYDHCSVDIMPMSFSYYKLYIQHDSIQDCVVSIL